MTNYIKPDPSTSVTFDQPTKVQAVGLEDDVLMVKMNDRWFYATDIVMLDRQLTQEIKRYANVEVLKQNALK